MFSQAEAIEKIKKEEAKWKRINEGWLKETYKHEKKKLNKKNKEIKKLGNSKSKLIRGIESKIIRTGSSKNINVRIPIKIVSEYLFIKEILDHLRVIMKEVINNEWNYEIRPCRCQYNRCWIYDDITLNLTSTPILLINETRYRGMCKYLELNITT